MRFRRTSFFTRYKPCTDPDSLGTVREICGETSPIVYGTRTDDIDWIASEWGFVAFDSVDTGRDEEGDGDIARVTATFTSLSADEINTGFEGSGDVFGMADHLSETLVFESINITAKDIRS